MTDREKEMIAMHESGHLIVMYNLQPTDDVFKASIISRKDTLGIVYSHPREELFTSNRERLLANIKVSLDGYVAEKLRLGVTSDGLAQDFKQWNRRIIWSGNMEWQQTGLSETIK